MGRGGPKKTKERRERHTRKAAKHPKPGKAPRAPVAGHHSKNAELPTMFDPWLVAPTAPPEGISLVQYNMIVADARISVWKNMPGLRFDNHSLPFLSIDEMKNLVQATLPGPRADFDVDDLSDAIRGLVSGALRVASEKNKDNYHPTAGVSKLTFYAALRQDFYNQTISCFKKGKATGKGNELMSSARAIAALEVEVFKKIIEACLAARLSYLEHRYPNGIRRRNSRSEDSQAEGNRLVGELADLMAAGMVMATERPEGAALPETDGQDMDKEQKQTGHLASTRGSIKSWKKEGSSTVSPQTQFLVQLDVFNVFVKCQQQQMEKGYAKWVRVYGTPGGLIAAPEEEDDDLDV